jgi:hypothetical protein
MKFKDLLAKYRDDKKRVLINGLGSGEARGLIIEVQEDYITYELLQIKKEKNSGKEKQNRELKYIVHNYDTTLNNC